MHELYESDFRYGNRGLRKHISSHERFFFKFNSLPDLTLTAKLEIHHMTFNIILLEIANINHSAVCRHGTKVSIHHVLILSMLATTKRKLQFHKNKTP